MRLETERLVIRDFEDKDANDVVRIVHQKNMLRFMADWAQYNDCEENARKIIAWRQTMKDSNDVFANKRYAVALKDTDRLIGMVGMGLEDTLNEVEMAYFTDEEYSGNGYATESLNKLFDWCMTISDLKYMILSIDCANAASLRVAEKAGFELFEKRTPISHRQPNMESDSYYYFRKYRCSDIKGE